MAYLRRSPALFHTASTLSAPSGHLPLEGKALSVVILFSTYACIRSDNARKAAFSYRSLPPWGRGTAQRWIGCSRKRRTCDDLLRFFFIPPEPYPPPFVAPSPRGEGFVSGTAALSQMPHLHSAQTKTALRRRALQSGF